MKRRQLIKFLQEKVYINESDSEKIFSVFRNLTIKKNTTLLKQGDICKAVYFITKGAMRAYTYNDNLREYTRIISIENHFIGNLSSFKDFKISDENIETLEDTECLVLHRDVICGLMEDNIKIKDLYINIIEDFNTLSMDKLNNILVLNDKEKVNYFFKNYKKFIQRFPDRINASFLNVTRENYSRYKKEVI